MSRVVKSIGKAVKSVARAVTKVVKTVAKSKVVRFIAVAAAAYFTAGAALGAMGTIGTTTSLSSGVMSGLGSAWGGLTGAGSALMSGNLAGVASSLGSGLTSASAAGASGMGFSAAAQAVSTGAAIPAAAAPAAAAPVAPGAAAPVAADVSGGASSYLLDPATGQAMADGAKTVATKTAEKGIVGKAFEFLGTQGGGMVASSALKLAGGAMSDNAEAKAAEDARNRANHNQNVAGLNTTFGPQATPAAITPGPVAVPGFDPNRFKSGLVGANVAPVG